MLGLIFVLFCWGGLFSFLSVCLFVVFCLFCFALRVII